MFPLQPLIYAALTVMTLMMQADAVAEEPAQYELVIRDARFTPNRIDVPANTKFRVTVKNEGPGAEEFESADLKKEKVIPPGASVTLSFIPLKPGIYRFFGEFHPETAQGVIVAK